MACSKKGKKSTKGTTKKGKKTKKGY